MGTYEGLDRRLKAAVFERDGHRCRWCGSTNSGGDAHHIRYRRGAVDDVDWNLITLCRRDHNFIHGSPNGAGDSIQKRVAQQLLWDVIDLPGQTASALWRQRKGLWVKQGRCIQHGEPLDECPDCTRR